MDWNQNAQQDRQVAPLPVGKPTPDFTLPQTPSSRFALHGLLGRPVVLVFYPLDWEPVSRDQLVLYQKFADEFEVLGARLLGISVGSVYCHAAFAARRSSTSHSWLTSSHVAVSRAATACIGRAKG